MHIVITITTILLHIYSNVDTTVLKKQRLSTIVTSCMRYENVNAQRSLHYHCLNVSTNWTIGLIYRLCVQMCIRPVLLYQIMLDERLAHVISSNLELIL